MEADIGSANEPRSQKFEVIFMKNIFTTTIFFAMISMLIALQLHADDRIKAQILKAFPQADRDGDGVLSDLEYKFVQGQVLTRFPQADKDGDGVLSDTETKSALRQAAKRSKKKKSAGNAQSRKKPDTEKFLAELGLKSERDIEYRKNTAQQRNKLDFIYPKKKVYEKAPLFIYIHGGGNTGGSKNVVYKKGNLIIKELTDAGIAVASIDYRVLGKGEDVGFQHLFQDCKDALRYLAKNSDRFGIDPHKMVTWGTSAGGSKALLTALTAGDYLPGEVSGSGTDHTVVGAISFYGATTYVVESAWEKRTNRSKASLIGKANSGLSAEEVLKLVSPDLHLKSNSPPILLVHGDTDPVVPIELSKHLHELAKTKGADVKFVEVENAGHGFASVRGSGASPSMTWDETQKLVIEQVFEWVKRD